MQQRQLSTAVIVTTSLSQNDKDELRRYRLREQRTASAEIACNILAHTRGSTHARARELHQSRTVHVRDHTQPKPPKVTLTSAYVHTTVALKAETAVPIRVPIWQRIWRWLHTELE